MKNYAMICNNKIIEVLYNQEVFPVWPPTILGEEIKAIECEEWVTTEYLYNDEENEFIPPTTKNTDLETIIEPNLEIIPQEEDLNLEHIKNFIIDEYTLSLIKSGALD